MELVQGQQAVADLRSASHELELTRTLPTSKQLSESTERLLIREWLMQQFIAIIDYLLYISHSGQSNGIVHRSK